MYSLMTRVFTPGPQDLGQGQEKGRFASGGKGCAETGILPRTENSADALENTLSVSQMVKHRIIR